MDDSYRIYIDQLRDGHAEAIKEILDPGFIDLHEEDLAFDDPVSICGEAYLAEHELVLHLDIETVATLPCTICNARVKVPISIRQAYFALPIEEVKGAVFDFRALLREQIILDAPMHAECQGKCPKRKEITGFIKQENSTSSDQGYQPFADFDFEQDES